ncbi:MAG TPA: UDP-N-acetylmuramoyl-L-alanine--D-glutamate ligase [Stellaceae bacterium]|nr:UDP-N-acetylmuramoyl-L-alanine--D-glutamate ligase [Stellaceae bacterium]
MIATLPYRDRTVGVLGLGRSGRVAAEALLASGARVLAWDDDAAQRDAAKAARIPLADLGTAEPLDWAALVMSPGIPLTHPTPHPVAARAQRAGIEVIGDIELLGRAGTGAGFIGITGTNGKSTTTALIHHVLRLAGQPVAVGGNLGIPALSLPRLGSDGRYVLEMSSFQLDLTTSLAFDIAVLLNVTPDHLDRHGDMAGYIAAKKAIFRAQSTASTAVVGIDDAICRDLHAELVAQDVARVIAISAEQPVPGGIAAIDGQLVDALDGVARSVLDLTKIATLPGRHNWQNAAAAYAVCRVAGLAAETIAAGIASYPGLAHRQELVATLDGVRFVNDSKATNADAASKALGCYDDIYWIAGGTPKAGGIVPLAPWFDRIRHAFLIGDAAEAFAGTLTDRVPFTRSGTLDVAVRQAADRAVAEGRPGAVVLLSPACASYDQFANFEARGDAFRGLTGTLQTAAAREAAR